MSIKVRNNSVTDNTPLQQFLTYRFSRLQAKLNAQAARMLKDLAGITVTQWRIIALVGSTGQATSAELVRISTIDKGLFSRNLKGLIRDDFVSAEIDKGDQRAQILSLSPRGQALYDRVLPRMRKRQRALKSGLTDNEITILLRALDKIEAVVESSEQES